ncbi:hypothetical protein TNCV_3252031 [Trichonephila clavipes]|nr:hypothetical protein TNCV_3252031 [Trichonephila clavipes]
MVELCRDRCTLNPRQIEDVDQSPQVGGGSWRVMRCHPTVANKLRDGSALSGDLNKKEIDSRKTKRTNIDSYTNSIFFTDCLNVGQSRTSSLAGPYKPLWQPHPLLHQDTRAHRWLLELVFKQQLSFQERLVRVRWD